MLLSNLLWICFHNRLYFSFVLLVLAHQIINLPNKNFFYIRWVRNFYIIMNFFIIIRVYVKWSYIFALSLLINGYKKYLFSCLCDDFLWELLVCILLVCDNFLWALLLLKAIFRKNRGLCACSGVWVLRVCFFNTIIFFSMKRDRENIFGFASILF